jgi:uncharacterized membrane protein YfcA
VWELVLIGLAAFVTSMLSAVAGLGGGLILLTILAQVQPLSTAIPVHGVIQFMSNGSRAWFLLDDVDWGAVWRSAVLVLPGSVAGVVVAGLIPGQAGLAALGLFALVVAWRPQLLRWRGDRFPRNGMLGVGGLSGFLNSTLGVSGPVVAPFFKAVTATHVAFVASAATSQVLAHSAKIAAYVLDGWRPLDDLDVIVVGIIGVTAGSRLGTGLLGRLSEETLAQIFKLVLTALALRLVIRALL